jgi:hypothetical protein
MKANNLSASKIFTRLDSIASFSNQTRGTITDAERKRRLARAYQLLLDLADQADTEARPKEEETIS